MHVLKLKSKITRYVKCFASRISTSQNLFKEIEIMNRNTPGRTTSFEQMFVGGDEIYLQKEKFKISFYSHLMKSKTK